MPCCTLLHTVAKNMLPKLRAATCTQARDFGRSLGTLAHVLSLRRESIGDFRIEDAWTLDVLLPLAKKYVKGYRNAKPR